MEIQYIKGDATAPQGEGLKIIAHVCNDIGSWGKGFVLAVSKRWTTPEEAYRKWYKERTTNNFNLGAIQLVKVDDNTYVVNMIGQRGIKRGNNSIPIKYEAIAECLQRLAKKAIKLEATVHMPRIGCGLAGGKWDKIEPIIKAKLIDSGVKTIVYDF